jgi:hypothetical protein
MNLWQFDGTPATNQEVVLDAFTFVPAGVVAVTPPAGPAPVLLAPHPNPFGASTTIRFVAARSGPAEIVVFDLLGRRQRTLLDGHVTAGEREVVWDGRDDTGAQAPAGVYLCRVRTDDIVQTRRMILVR